MTKRTLIVVDMQNDFITGSLPVPGAQEIIDPIRGLMEKPWNRIILTQDWHPPHHSSFKTWPRHCVAGRSGADFPTNDFSNPAHLIIRKGQKVGIDSYSAFKDDAGEHSGLWGYLNCLGEQEIYLCGVATEYCVKATAIDAQFLFRFDAFLNRNTFIIEDLVRGVNPIPAKNALLTMRDGHDIGIIQSSEIEW